MTFWNRCFSSTWRARHRRGDLRYVIRCGLPRPLGDLDDEVNQVTDHPVVIANGDIGLLQAQIEKVLAASQPELATCCPGNTAVALAPAPTWKELVGLRRMYKEQDPYEIDQEEETHNYRQWLDSYIDSIETAAKAALDAATAPAHGGDRWHAVLELTIVDGNGEVRAAHHGYDPMATDALDMEQRMADYAAQHPSLQRPELLRDMRRKQQELRRQVLAQAHIDARRQANTLNAAVSTVLEIADHRLRSNNQTEVEIEAKWPPSHFS